MFEWNDSFSVRIPNIDGQHQKLFRIAGELHAAMQAGNAQAAVSNIVDSLVQYVKVHFAYEERLMEQAGYPGAAEHKAQHEDLTRQVLQFQADLQSGKRTVSISLLHFLRNWLVNHIQTEDSKYAPFLKAA
ncbi:MAG TPA: bacteriohemerythrin [Bryobacteraceae bacterium]|nr:bacteriohemerythrin [Bryobacteraceae bacterium]